MATLEVTSQRPTLSEIAVAAAERGHPQSILAGTTREMVLAACKIRGIEVRDGRIDKRWIVDVYFGLRTLKTGAVG